MRQEAMKPHDRYVPRHNEGLVKLHSPGELAPEYERILPYVENRPLVEDEYFVDVDSLLIGSFRDLSIISDTVINIENHSLELIGDARFVFNALIAARFTKQTTLDIANFRSGFRGEHHPTPKHNNVSTNFLRAIQALDAAVLDASGDILIDRTSWGSGRTIHYYIKPDITVHDERLRVAQ